MISKALPTILLLVLAADAAAQQTPWSGAPFAVPGRIQAENYDRGAEGVAYHDTTAGNVFGVYRSDGMDVGAIPGGGHHIGFLAAGEWAEYTLNVPVTQAYEIRLRVASAFPGPNAFHLELNGTPITNTRTVANGGAWHSYSILTIPNVTLSAGGQQVLRVVFDTGAWNFDWIEVRGQTPWSGSPVDLPGRVQAENYDRGNAGLAYHDTTAGNVFGAYRTDSMDVGAIPGGGHHIGFLTAGEWAEYAVDVTQSGAYSLRLRLASAFPNTTRFRVLLDAVDVTGPQTVTSTGGWHNYIIKTVPVTLTAGNHRVLRLSFETGSWNLDWFELIRASCTAPTMTQHPASRTVTAGTNVTFQGNASGSPAPSFQWTFDGTPISGETSATLVVSNAQPADAGAYRLQASNACGTATSNPATLTVNLPHCGGPGDHVAELGRALRGQSAACDWTREVNQNFPNSMGDGTYNIPVIAGAIALVREPVRSGSWNMYTFWDTYLRGELGERGSAWSYGGKELTSMVYQHYNIASILAVHYQAHETGRTTLREQARRWLRATFAIHALSALPRRPNTFHDPIEDTVRVDNFVGHYSGPWLALGGMRSSENHWRAINRAIFFARASGLASNLAGESDYQNSVRTFLEGAWDGPNGSVYGLTSNEQTLLRGVLSGTLDKKVEAMYAGIHTFRRLHLVGWPGVRVTLMEENANNNTAPTYGVAGFDASRQAHMLYPWTRATPGQPKIFRNGIRSGAATLDLIARVMTATNGEATAQHPLTEDRIDGLPSGPTQFHVVLEP